MQTEPWLPEIVSTWGPLLPPSERPTVADAWANQNERQLLATSWLERWNSTQELSGTGRPIDGLFFPAFPHPAKPHQDTFPYAYSFR